MKSASLQRADLQPSSAAIDSVAYASISLAALIPTGNSNASPIAFSIVGPNDALSISRRVSMLSSHFQQPQAMAMTRMRSPWRDAPCLLRPWKPCLNFCVVGRRIVSANSEAYVLSERSPTGTARRTSGRCNDRSVRLFQVRRRRALQQVKPPLECSSFGS